MLKGQLILISKLINISTCSLETPTIISLPTIDKQPTIFIPSCSPPFLDYDNATQHICLNGENRNTAFSLEFSIDYKIHFESSVSTISNYYDLSNIIITFIKCVKKTYKGEYYNVAIHKPQYIPLTYGYECIFNFTLNKAQYLKNCDQYDVKRWCQYVSLGTYFPFGTIVTTGMVKNALRNFRKLLELSKENQRNYAFILHIQLSTTNLDICGDLETIICTDMFQVVFGVDECMANLEYIDPNDYHIGDDSLREISFESDFVSATIIS